MTERYSLDIPRATDRPRSSNDGVKPRLIWRTERA